MPADLLAEITAGSRWNRFEVYSDFPMTQEPLDGERGTRHTGQINGGGHRIILEASHGDIYIRKGP
jgi:hypothetical protein